MHALPLGSPAPCWPWDTRVGVKPVKHAEDGVDLVAQGWQGYRMDIDSADGGGHMASAFSHRGRGHVLREAEMRRLADVSTC